MKFTHSLFVIANCAIILSACAKKVSEPSANTNSQYELIPAFVNQVTPEQAKALDALIASEKITSPADFKKKVESIKSLNGALNRVADDDDASYNAATDYFLGNIATEQLSGDITYDDGSTRTISAVYQILLTYAKRGNQVLVRVPYQFDWKQANNTNTITNLRPTTRVELAPVGSYWGEVTQGNTWLVSPSGTYGDDPDQHAAAISAYGSAEEKRTFINTVEGKIKISTKADLAGFEAGAEIEGGYHVSRAWNIYNQYNVNAEGQIWLSPYLQNYTFPAPPSQFIGRTWGTQYGILKNE